MKWIYLMLILGCRSEIKENVNEVKSSNELKIADIKPMTHEQAFEYASALVDIWELKEDKSAVKIPFYKKVYPEYSSDQYRVQQLSVNAMKMTTSNLFYMWSRGDANAKNRLARCMGIINNPSKRNQKISFVKSDYKLTDKQINKVNEYMKANKIEQFEDAVVNPGLFSELGLWDRVPYKGTVVEYKDPGRMPGDQEINILPEVEKLNFEITGSNSFADNVYEVDEGSSYWNEITTKLTGILNDPLMKIVAIEMHSSASTVRNTILEEKHKPNHQKIFSDLNALAALRPDVFTPVTLSSQGVLARDGMTHLELAGLRSYRLVEKLKSWASSHPSGNKLNDIMIIPNFRAENGNGTSGVTSNYQSACENKFRDPKFVSKEGLTADELIRKYCPLGIAAAHQNDAQYDPYRYVRMTVMVEKLAEPSKPGCQPVEPVDSVLEIKIAAIRTLSVACTEVNPEPIVSLPLGSGTSPKSLWGRTSCRKN